MVPNILRRFDFGDHLIRERLVNQAFRRRSDGVAQSEKINDREYSEARHHSLRKMRRRASR